MSLLFAGIKFLACLLTFMEDLLQDRSEYLKRQADNFYKQSDYRRQDRKQNDNQYNQTKQRKDFLPIKFITATIRIYRRRNIVNNINRT